MASEFGHPDSNNFFSTSHAGSHGSSAGSGQLFLLGANGQLSPVETAHHGGGGSGGSNHGSPPPPPPPSFTLVTTPGSNLEIKLIWDSSVAHAPSGFMNAAITAAQFYTSHFSSSSLDIINIDVGYGEVGGQTLPSGALAASESYGLMENYSTVSSALKKDASSSTWQAQADTSLPTSDPTNGGSFFVTTAEAKALGLMSGTASGVDGYVGLNSSYSFSYNQSSIGSNQFDAVGAFEHEISEVMGRVGSVGSIFGSNVYTPLDLFRYSSAGVRDLTAGPGYLSVNGGATNLGTYNNPNNGGDASDWIPSLIGDSYGDGYPGRAAVVSPTDLIEDSLLGYRMTPLTVSQTQNSGLA
jgi:hypothetical protein